MNRLVAASGSKEILFVSERNSFIYPLQRMGKYPLLLRAILDNISDDVNKDVKARFEQMAESSDKYMSFFNQSKDLYLRLTELQEAGTVNSAKIEKLKNEIFNSIPNVDGLAKFKLFVGLHDYLDNKGRHSKEARKIIDIILNNDSLEHIVGQIKVMGELGSSGRLHALVADFMDVTKKNIDAAYELSESSDTVSSDSEPTHDDESSLEVEPDELIKIADEALAKSAESKNPALDDLKANLTKYLNEKNHPINHKKIANELHAMIVRGDPADKIIIKAIAAQHDLAANSKLKRMVFRTTGGELDSMLSNYLNTLPQAERVQSDKIRFVDLLQTLQDMNIKAGHAPENDTTFTSLLRQFKKVSVSGADVVREKTFLLSHFKKQLSQHMEQHLDRKEAKFMQAVIHKLEDFKVLSNVSIAPALKQQEEAAPEPPKNRGPR